MSKISLASNASGTGIFTLASPATNTNRTLTLPDSTGTLLDTNGGTITGTLTVTGVTTLGNGAVLGVPASGTATNLTGLPLTSGVTGTLPVANGGTNLTSFTSGGVVYASSAGVLATGSALTFNGTSLGVGSSSYGDPGSISTSIGVPGTTTGGVQLWSNTTSTHSIQWGDGTTGSDTYRGAIEYAHNGDSMRFYTSATEQMRLTSTGLGIGTTSPSSRLDVSGVISLQGTTLPSAGTARFFSRSSDSGLYIQSATGGVTYLLDGSQNTMYSVSPTSHLWAISNATKMILDASGNLGIGTTLPGAKLQIDSGDIRLQGNAPGKILFFSIGNGVSQNATLEVQNDGGTTNTGEFRFSTRNVATTLAERVRITAEGYLGIGTSSPAGKLSVIGGGVAGVTTYLGGTVDDGLMLGYVPSTGLAEIIGVNHAFSAYNDIGLRAGNNTQLYLSTGGNVGIGTSITAVAKVNIQLAGTVISGSTTGVTMGAGAIFQLNNSNAGVTNSTVMLLGGGTGDTTVGQISSGIGFTREDEATWGTQLRFYTHNSATDVLSTLNEQMRITSAGNVGIGTTSPGYRLEVVNAASTPAAATFRTSGFADDNVSTVFIQDDTANAIGVGGRIAFRGLNDVGSYTSFATIRGAKENSTTGNNAGAMIFKTQPNGGTLTEWMRIDSSGNVGIGATSPAFKVDISGGGTTAKFNTLDTNDGGASLSTWQKVGRRAGTGTNAYINTLHSGSDAVSALTWAFGTSGTGTEAMRLESSGFFKTRANGGAYFGGSNNQILNNNNTSGDVCLLIGNAAGNATNNTSSYHFIASDASGDRLYIYGNGNVVNINNSYGTLSDVKLKENIVDATPKLDDVMRLQVRNFNLKSNPELKQIGFVAQELEQIFPALIDESPDRDAEGNITEEMTKSIKTSVLVPILVKAMQEQQALITQLTARITALETA